MDRSIHLNPTMAVVAACATAMLAGCGGSGSSGSPSSSASQMPSSLSGTVAAGNAVANANIQIIDANGKALNATADSSGNYTAPLSGLTTPLLIVANDPAGMQPALYSVLAALPTGSAPAVVNVTTLTSALSALLTASGNPVDLAQSGSLSSHVTPSAVDSAGATLNAALKDILSQNGLNAASFNAVASPFGANHTGQDAVIDSVQMVPAPAGGFKLVSAGDPSVAIALNSSATPGAPLAALPVPANFLASATALLGQCIGGASASCAQTFDSSYLENGHTTFLGAHPEMAASGITLGYPTTLKFLSANGAQKALVAFPFTRSDGTAGAFVTVAQQTGSGSWNIVGNQQPFDVRITSMLERRQFVDTDDAPYSRYDAGLLVDIPVGGVNPANLASVAVSGPGINGTAYLLPSAATGSGEFAFSSHPLTAPPTGGLLSQSNTALYRWSWQSLPGATGTYSPGADSLGFNTPAPIDTSSVPMYATYNVTFYDSTGAQIGQPISVTNPSPVMAAANGAGVTWQTLSSATIQSFLTPGGAASGAATQVSAAWSASFGQIADAAPLVTSLEASAFPGTGAASTTIVDGWWTGSAGRAASGQYSATATAGVNSSGNAECSGCQFPALTPGGARIVSLDWTTMTHAHYYNIWKVYE
ncbi:hypothetical protein C7410_11684 [Paraburkholderia silvatlantica]|uniref:Uncharacterized protein n=1 Tax=Paraburkholderia silvatlantica TaxID=321895 RepID=A0A2V4TBB0_9BURK|nr:hypothetical protein [Paraburkholderia silvatlantica]PYE20546.1 hypothetical protein C7410_11684 [Paraburkholderia silvatlantica]